MSDGCRSRADDRLPRVFARAGFRHRATGWASARALRRIAEGKAKMKYVIIRDDDTNALTPIECLERLYRPFLERNLPVGLATIPDVRSDVRLPNGEPEGFLVAAKGV